MCFQRVWLWVAFNEKPSKAPITRNTPYGCFSVFFGAFFSLGGVYGGASAIKNKLLPLLSEGLLASWGGDSTHNLEMAAKRVREKEKLNYHHQF